MRPCARRVLSLVVVATVIGFGCGAPSGSAPEPAATAEHAAPPASGPPTAEELENATYHVTVGTTIGTRMACPEPAASVEGRFLSQLGGVIKYGFMLGELALTYQTDEGGVGVMLFDERPTGGEPS